MSEIEKPSYVLVVDDDPAVHTLFGIMLKPLSLEVRSALDGDEALRIVSTERPSLIILDLQMPTMNGFEVLEHLGANSETADIPVIIFSAVIRFPPGNSHEWPVQTVKVIEKAGMRPSELREVILDQLCR